MRIDTTKHLTYELSSIYKCAATLAYLYEWMPTQAPNVQGLLSVTIDLLEKEYERANQHYIAFANQALKTREIRNG